MYTNKTNKIYEEVLNSNIYTNVIRETQKFANT